MRAKKTPIPVEEEEDEYVQTTPLLKVKKHKSHQGQRKALADLMSHGTNLFSDKKEPK